MFFESRWSYQRTLFAVNDWAKALRKIWFNFVHFCVEDFMEMRHHKLEIMLKDRKIGKSDRKIGSDFEEKKDRIGRSDRLYF